MSHAGKGESVKAKDIQNEFVPPNEKGSTVVKFPSVNSARRKYLD